MTWESIPSVGMEQWWKVEGLAVQRTPLPLQPGASAGWGRAVEAWPAQHQGDNHGWWQFTKGCTV